MRIVTARRISQAFFLTLFVWFCVVTTVGDSWWRLRGWPVNWFLSLDPLTGLATALATRTLYGPLWWSLTAIALTLFVGRFFCGFACPLGTLNQLVGWLGLRSLSSGKRVNRIDANRHRPLQAVKYYLLVFLLACAALGSVQTGLLDPLPLLHRSLNLALAPLADPGLGAMHDEPRSYVSVWLPAALFLAIIGLNLALPRFFCRFVCPLGALFGLLSRYAPWRIGKKTFNCGDCRICEEYCEGACRPSGKLIVAECTLCMNCLNRCPASRITFAGKPSAAGESALPNLTRRGIILAGAGFLVAPLWRTGALAGANRNAALIRPPGALDEDRFLARCIRCGQCMRVCPSNIVQPTLFEAGIQGLWTPTLNYRVGRSGCQPNCIACGQLCPTAAIRSLSIEEKLGLGDYAARGPVRVGAAFVDLTRCLPWVMDRPCLVCQELCPVSPKAIFTRTVFDPIRDGQALPARVGRQGIELGAALATTVNLASGDYYVRPAGQAESGLRRIVGVSGVRLAVEGELEAATQVDIVVRLQRPFVDAARCIGCGMCEHECPVSGLRAIRVSSENESRSAPGRMLI